jgi:glycosyltransferase involved in cell wall biosynthesis
MQRHTHDLVRGLTAAGHEVEVICPAAEGLTADLYGARWHLVSTTGRSDPRMREKYRDAFLAASATRPFDVVHSESTAALGLMELSSRPPVVVKYHGNYLGLAKAHLRRMVTRPRTAVREGATLVRTTLLHVRHRNASAFRDCVTIVPARQQVKDTRRSHLVRRDLVFVVANGVDAEAFAPRDRAAVRGRLGLPDGELVVAVGRLARDKGFDVTVSAFARVARDHPRARLLVIGDGEERAALEELAARLGVAGQVDFLGALPGELVAEHLAASDVFVFSTLREEAAPLVLPEAMASGLAVIASSLGGITEVLEDERGGRYGVLVPANDPGAVADALRRLLDDPDERRRLGELALQRVRDQYTLDRMIEKTVEVYRVAISRAARARVG